MAGMTPTDKTKKLADYLEVISLQNSDEFICLKLFDNTPLRNTVYIKITIFEQLLSLDGHAFKPNMYKWVDKLSGARGWEDAEDEILLSIDDLVKTSEAVRLYCKKFHPDRII